MCDPSWSFRFYTLFFHASGMRFKKTAGNMGLKVINERGQPFALHNGIPLPGTRAAHYDLPTKFEALGDNTVPRYMIVRDPYARVLSGFLEKILGQKGFRREIGMVAEEVPSKDPAGFQVFLDALDAKFKENPARIDPHFAPQSGIGKYPMRSSGCQIQEGFQYDYILKLEEISEWMADFIVMNGLEGRTRTGWGRDEKLGTVSESNNAFPLLRQAPPHRPHY